MFFKTRVSCQFPQNVLAAPNDPEQRAQCLNTIATLSQATRKALVIAMRSWAGVHLLASDSRGLVTLMRLLRDPSTSFSEDAGLQDVRCGSGCCAYVVHR